MRKDGASRGKRILVAEDDVINRLLIEQYLGILGCFFKVVENGRMALAELGKSDYDLVLMDIEMPDMDGVMALGLIRNSPGYNIKNIPVIAMTGYAESDYHDMDIGRSFDGFISKPFSLRDLEDMIAKALKNRLD